MQTLLGHDRIGAPDYAANALQLRAAAGSYGVPRCTFGRPFLSAPGVGTLYESAWQSEAPLALARLRAACIARVRRLREDGLAPEKVVVALKTEITRASKSHRPPTLSSVLFAEDDRSRARVYEQLFGWFLDTYFET